MLGLTNWLGFGFYIVSVLLTNSLVLLINAQSAPSKYFISPSPPTKPLTASSSNSTAGKNSKAAGAELTIDPRSGSFSPQDVASFLVNGLTDNAFSFILWWTFWFGIVHGKFINANYESIAIADANAHTALIAPSLHEQCMTSPRH